MPEPTPAQTRVLFVDDDSGFLEMVNRVFGELSQGTWDIFLAGDAASALRLLKKQSVDLAVLDVCMPGVDGLQLLEILNRDCPTLPKVLLTGGTNSATRVAGLEGGADLFLEKPTTPPGFQTVFATLNELVKWHQKQGERGTARRAGLLDVVKMECVSGNSHVFEVQAGETRGLIYVKEGSIVHAETEGRRGQSAFTFLATLPDSEFSLKQSIEAPEHSIYRQWEFLFLEAFQLREQLSQVEARTTEPRATQQPPLPGTQPPAAAAGAATSATRPEPSAVAAVAKMATPTISGGTGLSTRAPVSAPTPKPALPEVGHLKMVRTAPGARVPRPAPAQLEVPARKPAPARLWAEDAWRPALSGIGEMLISSNKQEVLHEWQCRQADERLQFVGRLRKKAAHLSETLPLGPCDRLELREPDARVQVLFQADAALLVRSSAVARPAAKGLPSSSQPIPDWLDRYSRTRGLLASSILHASGKVVTSPSSTESAWPDLTALWRGTMEVFEWNSQQQSAARQLRWVFERAQLYCLKRADDLALAVLVTKDPQLLDVPVLEQMFAEFETLHAV